MQELLLKKFLEVLATTATGLASREVFNRAIKLIEKQVPRAISESKQLFEFISGLLKKKSESYSKDVERFENNPDRYKNVLEDDLVDLLSEDDIKSEIAKYLRNYEMVIGNLQGEITTGDGSRIAYANNGSVATTGDVGGDITLGSKNAQNKENKEEG